MFYYNTDILVELGDHVEVTKGFYGRRFQGVVCYLPGVSPSHPGMISDSGSLHWAIELKKGHFLSWLFVPERRYANRIVRFISRGEPGYIGLLPSDPSPPE